MTVMTAKYLGNLRVECSHEQSGAVILTDAPTDNQGKGEAFSPTDLVATALAACATTIMGIYAQNHDCDITGTTVRIEKHMSKEPRRIGRIDVVFTMPDRDYSDKQKQGLERAALTCPVHKSLHPDMEQNFVFNWAK
jgi:Predicted redox protein, regulator of disulfide bond formation